MTGDDEEIRNGASSKSTNEQLSLLPREGADFRNAASSESMEGHRSPISPELSWTHYRSSSSKSSCVLRDFATLREAPTKNPPAATRHRNRYEPGESYYHASFHYEALIRELLAPLGQSS